MPKSQLELYAGELMRAGVERPWKELRMMVAHVLGCSYEDVVLGDQAILESKVNTLEALVLRRAAHEPLTKIIGEANFWDHTFYTTCDTLDPRPESELFIETVLNLYTDKAAPLSFLDLGTGTGCLLLTCLSEYPNAKGVGVDNSPAALAVAAKNAQRLGLEARARFVLSNWNDAVEEGFDVVLCNPPYVKEGEQLAQEVLFDPAGALFAGEDGLAAYREVFPKLRKSVMQ
ncbi:MAG: peptide chain release factor N(5)-glutamine methyltransferase, partial [Holosporales bacterium]|nr:peptide chain release factor N(5)-glutamine methyltransferase [Holosporales bacterium]